MKLLNLLKKFKNKYNLSNKGERVDIIYKEKIDFEGLDIYQKSHFKRYQFAKKNISKGDFCGDMACGTGYGTAILSKKAELAIGVDIDKKTINSIKRRYRKIRNLEFSCSNLLDINYKSKFDVIISFETIEHLHEKDIPILFNKFNQALKINGIIIFSVPYEQKESEEAIKLGFHLTFNIDENKILRWLSTSGFEKKDFLYQNYITHDIVHNINNKDFIICIAKKIK